MERSGRVAEETGLSLHAPGMPLIPKMSRMTSAGAMTGSATLVEVLCEVGRVEAFRVSKLKSGHSLRANARVANSGHLGAALICKEIEQTGSFSARGQRRFQTVKKNSGFRRRRLRSRHRLCCVCRRCDRHLNVRTSRGPRAPWTTSISDVSRAIAAAFGSRRDAGTTRRRGSPTRPRRVRPGDGDGEEAPVPAADRWRLVWRSKRAVETSALSGLRAEELGEKRRLKGEEEQKLRLKGRPSD